MKKKRKTPSRIKYERDHPTVSLRVTKELKNRMQAVKEAEGSSITDVLKVGVGLLEVKISKEKEAKKQGYEEGFEKGYEEAEELYKVTYPCKVCQRTLVITSAKGKAAIRRYMLEHGWGHADCINRRY